MVDNGTVVALGLAVVFLVLIILIVVITVLGKIMQSVNKKNKTGGAASQTGTVSAPVNATSAVIPNKGEFIAAVSAAVAEETGTDVSRIRIHKIEKVG